MTIAKKLYYKSIAKNLVEGKPLVLHKASKNKMKNKMFSNSGLPESFSGLDVTESIRTKKNKFY